MPSPLLEDTSKPVKIYADASALREINLGAWAYCVPAWDHSDCGALECSDSTTLELIAAMKGIEYVYGRAYNNLCGIEVMTDCDYVRKWIRELARRAARKSTKTRIPKKDSALFDCLLAYVHAVPIFAGTSNDSNPHHKYCHDLSRKMLFDKAAESNLLAKPVAEFQKAESERKDLLSLREGIDSRLAVLDEFLLHYGKKDNANG